MLYSSNIKEMNIRATDGDIGKIKDIYFNDNWNIRFTVVDTRKWLPGRKVLLPLHIFHPINYESEYVEVDYDKDQIRNSPPVPEDEHFTPDDQGNVLDYFGWNMYKDNAVSTGGHSPLVTFDHPDVEQKNVPEEPHLNRNEILSNDTLRSEEETLDFKVHAKDGKIGNIVDFICDENNNWKITYIVVQNSENMTENELYIYRTEQIQTVDWFERDLYINDSVKGLKGTTPFTDKNQILSNLS